MLPVTYTLRHGKRKKTVALRVLPDGEVTVYAPKFTPTTFINRFVDSRIEWIKRRRQHFDELREKRPPLEFVSGEAIPVFGRTLRLKVDRKPTLNRTLVSRHGNRLHITIPPNESKRIQAVRGCLEDWLTEKTASYIHSHIETFKKLLGVSPTMIRVVSQGKRWGSCSRKGALRFNWKLSMMPSSIVNYVIVHELCHIKVPNHSEKFWRVVQSVLPDYKKRREWLRKNGEALWVTQEQN